MTISGSGSALRSAVVVVAAGGSSGLLYWGAIPPTSALPLAWICLLPGLLAACRLPSRSLVVCAALAGIASGIGRVYWIADTLVLYGNVPDLAALLTNALLIAYLSLYWIAYFLLCARFDPQSPTFPWLAASAWVVLEWMQSWVITGFPWALLGYALHDSQLLLQTASLAGIYGLSFLVALVNAAIAQYLHLMERPVRTLLPPALLILAALLYGSYRWHALEPPTGPSVTVGVVQGNITQDEKWDPDRLGRTVAAYEELTRDLAAAASPDLIVFPETALPMYFRDPSYAPLSRRITALASDIGIPLIVGSLDGSRSDPEARIYNRAFLVDATGEIVDHADKVHLVPFGEYLPLPFLFGYLEGLTAESGRFAPGIQHKRLAAGGTDLGIFVCFESVFPGITRFLAANGAKILVNTTNDAWFGHSAAPHQHFAMAGVRAVETGRSVVRAANTGISGLLSPRGEILAATELFATEALVLEVSPRTEMTPYVRFGDILVGLCAVALIGGFARVRNTRLTR